MDAYKRERPVEILLVEDNPGDERLTQEAFKEGRCANHLRVVTDGEAAIEYLKKEGPYAEVLRPDLILLDLNLPKKDGREVLQFIKQDENFRRIPVIVLTTSGAYEDIQRSYSLNANCYIAKPVDFDQFMEVIKKIEDFWFTIVKLPEE